MQSPVSAPTGVRQVFARMLEEQRYRPREGDEKSRRGSRDSKKSVFNVGRVRVR